MKHIKLFENYLFEYRTGKKIKTRWTKDDAILTLYYYKHGLRMLGYSDDRLEEFVNEYIGSTARSMRMQTLNIQYILTKGGYAKGLSDFSKAQEDAVKKYNELSEPELRKVVLKIMNSLSDDEKLNNLIRAQNAKKEEEKFKPIVSEIPSGRYGGKLRKFDDLHNPDEKIPFEKGDIVYHNLFGKGVVKDVLGNWLDIDFDKPPKGHIGYIIYNPEDFDLNYKEEIPFVKPQFVKPQSIQQNIEYKPKIESKPKERKVRIKKMAPKKEETIIDSDGRRLLKFSDIKSNLERVPFDVGDIINHKRFGEGKILNIIDNKMSIQFEDEIRNLIYKPELFEK